MGPCERRTALLVRRLAHPRNSHSVRLARAALWQARAVDADPDDAWRQHRLKSALDALRSCGPEATVLDRLRADIWDRRAGQLRKGGQSS